MEEALAHRAEVEYYFRELSKIIEKYPKHFEKEKYTK